MTNKSISSRNKKSLIKHIIIIRVSSISLVAYTVMKRLPLLSKTSLSKNLDSDKPKLYISAINRALENQFRRSSRLLMNSSIRSVMTGSSENLCNYVEIEEDPLKRDKQ